LDPRVAEFFDRYATDFDSIYGNSGGLANGIANRFFRRSMKLRFIKTLEGCPPVDGKDVLDIGCGPGHYSVALARMGARSVLGIDFAEGMLGIARARAQEAGVSDICRFEKADFLAGALADRFDYVIVMGFMDYMEDAEATIRRVLALTRGKAFFSFPVAGGLLAWQRKLRYRDRCALYLYTRSQVERLFETVGGAVVTIEKIDRDFFVTATKA
jgi:2-polyprenyl-3-methyl-5-hydroxy-6-metoxy-1,4-benzoquinol methylase